MLKKEFYKTRADGVNLFRYYSTIGVSIEKIETGQKYEEAIDVENSTYTYKETDEPIPGPDPITPEDLMTALEGIL